MTAFDTEWRRLTGERCRDEDRVIVAEDNGADRFWLVLADGAGGLGDGGEIAQAALDRILDVADSRPATVSGGVLEELLADVDASLVGAGGETTLVVVVLDETGIRGASVGDSEAWLVRPGSERPIRLTAGQRRTPRIGTGVALPIGFDAPPLDDATLVVGSDGLFSYAKPAAILAAARTPALDAAADALVDAARLPNGTLQDDLSLLICRDRR